MHPDETAVWALIRAIALRQPHEASRLLAASPHLARQAVAVAATRQEASAYFFEAICHYVYAGDTPLHIAAAAHELPLTRELISHGAPVRARNRRGAEPLHYATDGGPGGPGRNPEAQSAIIVQLVEAGADPNTVDSSGVAPLHRAVRNRCAAAVGALLSRGADSRRKNKSGSTPLHLAVQNTGHSGSGTSEAREQQAAIIRLLLEHGARPTDKDAKGKTAKAAATSTWILDLLE